MSEELLIGKIRTDGVTLPQNMVDEDVVDKYAKAIWDGQSFSEFVREHPMEVFIDHTYLGHLKSVADIIEKNSPPGYFPFIDYDTELGFVYHTLLTPGGTKSMKNIAERFNKKEGNSREEEELEKILYKRLMKRGDKPRRQVRCSCGIADIVTERAIFEVKVTLCRRAVISAIGQVLAYKQCIDKSLKPYIAGRKCSSFSAESICHSLGIGIVYLPEGDSQ